MKLSLISKLVQLGYADRFPEWSVNDIAFAVADAQMMSDQVEVDRLEEAHKAEIAKLKDERDMAIKERDDLKAEEWRIVGIVDDLMDSIGLGIQHFPASQWNAWEEISMKVAGKRL